MNEDLEVEARLKDYISKNLNKIEKNLKEFQKKAGHSFEEPNKKASRFMDTLKGFVGAEAVIGVFRKLGGAFKFAFDTIANFDQTMSKVKAILTPTAKEFDKLSKKARQLGEDTLFSASEAGQAFVEMGKLGATTNEIIDASSGVLSLAQISQIGMAESSEVLLKTLNQFNLEASESNRIVDIMAKSFTTSALDINKFRESMKFAGIAAGSLEIPFERVTGMLGVLADRGLEGSLAGTGLRFTLSQLSQEGSKAGKAIGLVNNDSRTYIERLEDIKSLNLSTGQIMEMFGERAGNVANVLIQNIDSLEMYEKALKESKGTADEMAEAMTDNIPGAIKLFQSALEGLILKFSGGMGLEEVIARIILKARELIQWFTKNSEEILSWAKAIGIAIGVMTTLYGILVGIPTLIASIKKAMIALNIAMNANPIGIIITAIGLLTIAIVKLWGNFDGFRAFWKSAWMSIKKVFTNVIGVFFDYINMFVGAMKSLREAMSNPLSIGSWKKAVNDVGGIVKNFFGEQKERVKTFAKEWSEEKNEIYRTEEEKQNQKNLEEKKKQLMANQGELASFQKKIQGESPSGESFSGVTYDKEKLESDLKKRNEDILRRKEEIQKLEREINERNTKLQIEANRELYNAMAENTQGYFERKEAIFEAELKKEREKFSQHEGALTTIEKAQEIRRAEFQKKLMNEKIQYALDYADTYAGALSTIGKASKMSALHQKRIAQTQAIINTAQAVTKALAQGGLLGMATASILAAKGAAQVAIIEQQKFARGTSYAKGGNALVGEQGAELVVGPRAGMLPTGSTVYNNTETKNMLGGNKTYNINIEAGMDEDRIVGALEKLTYEGRMNNFKNALSQA